MKLQTKILSAVIGIISIVTIASAYLEVRQQMRENAFTEDESQFIQTANVISTFELAIWQINTHSAETGLVGLFESPSVRRAQIFNSRGEIFAGMSRPSKSDGNNSVNIDGRMNPVVDKNPMVPAESLKNAVKPYSKIPFEKILKEDIAADMRRISVALWYSEGISEPEFIGHLIFEYSLEKAFARARSTMIRLIILY
ncbi:MAG: hypothetical protein HQK54_05190, partial [Oligoflexales bacterium]|nr:hypothetical protein [Oligoflexales bacterium]